MRVAVRISLLAIGLVASFAAGAAVAGALVEFPIYLGGSRRT
jgi:hypothetical protein